MRQLRLRDAAVEYLLVSRHHVTQRSHPHTSTAYHPASSSSSQPPNHNRHYLTTGTRCHDNRCPGNRRLLACKAVVVHCGGSSKDLTVTAEVRRDAGCRRTPCSRTSLSALAAAEEDAVCGWRTTTEESLYHYRPVTASPQIRNQDYCSSHQSETPNHCDLGSGRITDVTAASTAASASWYWRRTC